MLTVEIFDQTLPQLVKKTLVYTSLNASDVTHHVLNVKDQDWVRSCLEIRGLVTFVPDGAVLPRKSGADDEPMNDKSADNGVSDSTQPLVRFLSPDTLRVTFDLPNMKRVRWAKQLLDWAVSANLVPRVIFDPPNDDGDWTNDPTSRSPNSICVNIVETYLLPAAYGGAGGVEVRARAADTIIVDDEDDDNDDHDRHGSTSWGDDDRVALAKRRAIDYSARVRAVADATRAMNKMRRMHIDYPEHIYPDSLGVKVELNVWSKRAMLLGEERRRRDSFDQTGGLGSAGVVVSSDGVGGDVVVVAIPWRCCVGWNNGTRRPADASATTTDANTTPTAAAAAAAMAIFRTGPMPTHRRDASNGWRRSSPTPRPRTSQRGTRGCARAAIGTITFWERGRGMELYADAAVDADADADADANAAVGGMDATSIDGCLSHESGHGELQHRSGGTMDEVFVWKFTSRAN